LLQSTLLDEQQWLGRENSHILFYAQNMADTLKEIGSDIKVKVGLRKTSPSWKAAQAVGFTEVSIHTTYPLLLSCGFPPFSSSFPSIIPGSRADAAFGELQDKNTLGTQDDVIKESDLVMLLISDAAQANDYKTKIGEYYTFILLLLPGLAW